MGSLLSEPCSPGLRSKGVVLASKAASVALQTTPAQETNNDVAQFRHGLLRCMLMYKVIYVRVLF